MGVSIFFQSALSTISKHYFGTDIFWYSMQFSISSILAPNLAPNPTLTDNVDQRFDSLFKSSFKSLYPEFVEANKSGLTKSIIKASSCPLFCK